VVVYVACMARGQRPFPAGEAKDAPTRERRRAVALIEGMLMIRFADGVESDRTARLLIDRHPGMSSCLYPYHHRLADMQFRRIQRRLAQCTESYDTIANLFEGCSAECSRTRVSLVFSATRNAARLAPQWVRRGLEIMEAVQRLKLELQRSRRGSDSKQQSVRQTASSEKRPRRNAGELREVSAHAGDTFQAGLSKTCISVSLVAVKLYTWTLSRLQKS
jgi:hypothetical protein